MALRFVFSVCFCLYPIPQCLFGELGVKGERLWWSTNRFRRLQVLAKPDPGSEIERDLLILPVESLSPQFLSMELLFPLKTPQFLFFIHLRMSFGALVLFPRV